MTEQNTSPAAMPIENKAPKPPGLMPKNVQAWVMLGVAVLMILIMWLTSGKKPSSTPKSNVSGFQPSAQPAVNEAQVAALQNRIQRLQQQQEATIKQQNKFFGSLPSGTEKSGDPQVSDPSSASASDPMRAEEQRLDYTSLFASNVALSYRKQSQHPQSSDYAHSATGAPGLPYAPSAQPDVNELAQLLAQAPPIPPQAPPPNSLRNHESPATKTEENREEHAPTNSANSDLLDLAKGKTYILFEGTILDTVLLNRLSGDLAGPVECMVTSNIYSHDRQHLLIPAGTKVLGEAKPVNAFGQTRLAVAFHRLIMPDGYSVSLDQFKGMNQIGDTGLRDQVNNHYFKIFGASLAVGAIGGISEAQSSGLLNQTGIQGMEAGVGQSMGQTSQRILDKFLNILPTITIREGHRVKIYLSGDLALPDYANHRMPHDL